MRLTAPALTCLLAAAALAADPDRTKMTPAELFRKADKDGDGRLTAGEFVGPVHPSPKHGPQVFNRADKDGDGRLTLAEMTAALDAVPWWKLSRKTPAEFLKAADADGDGRLNLAEFRTVDPHKNHADAHFQKFDADADGKLSAAEFGAFIAAELREKG